jgi:hypothetical protein
MIDEYGALLPHSQGQCAVANKVIGPGTLSADYVCKGQMKGKGALDYKWLDPEHAKGTVHFVGTLLLGSETQSIEWTTEATSVFKSADCGEVKPVILP